MNIYYTMENVITIDSSNQGEFFGPLASKYAYKPELRKVIDKLYFAATRSTNRYFVLEGTIVRAAQSSRNDALSYMDAGKVLVEIVLGCGKQTHVMGTNGGTMPCGALLCGEVYYCASCERLSYI